MTAEPVPATHLGHGRRPWLGYWPEPGDDPGVAVRREPVEAVTPDGFVTRGVLYLPPTGTEAHTLVALAHPRGDFMTHYALAPLAAAGFAVCGFNTRYVNNDTDCLHESCALDVQTMVAALRPRFDNVVLIGNSGGASLMAYAIATAPDPAGLADGFILSAAHPGQGVFLQQVIDPSVTDEDDPFSVDPSLDMYDPDNGWKPWPNPCSYDPAFMERYRAAQVERVARIDARAHAALAAAEEARTTGAALDASSSAGRDARRRMVHMEHLKVFRTLADPAYLDLSIEPDDRAMGSIFAFPDPFVANSGLGGLARIMTARGWLSTWSGLSSKASLAANLPKVPQPLLFVHPTGDTEIRLRQARGNFDAAAGTDKTYVEVAGAAHYFQGRRKEVNDLCISWLKDKGF